MSTLVEHEFLLFSQKGPPRVVSDLLLYGWISTPKQFKVWDPLVVQPPSWSHASVHVCGGLHLNCIFLKFFVSLLISLSHHQIMSMSPSYGPYDDSIQTGLHSFCIQL